MNKVKVLVVDDSAFMRKMISEILNQDIRIEVIATARNGKDCLDQLDSIKPDVITMDVEMPKLDGLQTLESIMERKPLPVVMLSSLTGDGAESTLKALSLGAVDFVEKPSGSISLDIERVASHLVRKVIAASRAKVKAQPVVNSSPPRAFYPKSNHLTTVVAIGTSTGGPRALQKVLTELPADFPAPIVVVQHMPKGFTHSLANRLNKLSSLHVKEAVHNEELKNGVAYIAPGDFHLEVIKMNSRLLVQLNQSEVLNGHRPSVNAMFTSLASLPDVYSIAVVMTGMGADGMEGLMHLKETCPQTVAIAEAEESCIIYGMPKAIVKTGLADVVSPLEKISGCIIKSIGEH
ncbi:chemotaxis response regulator protein-glutamate methylesterase [Halobacillus salinarum]|uniref:Protein-glutamate methylesterase/protein-glutamine glutaminase n=1 Tax=Halobacillus salinarum TaxID=2932257 RepID=A0ABY4EFW0_9BACI|nr:chemotaxis response regulator protein-glutamate methylesterase [Halobacillus salinarum]UOQ43036.1 chemotaxis response regulator protein-glutamate methylesterase [Halobacillus salinarum]